MAITLKNGASRTRDYEEVGLRLNCLTDQTQRFNNQLNHISTQIFNDFMSVKNDFEQDLIFDHTYHEILRQLKGWLDKNPAPYPTTLNEKLILDQIKKHKIEC